MKNFRSLEIQGSYRILEGSSHWDNVPRLAATKSKKAFRLNLEKDAPAFEKDAKMTKLDSAHPWYKIVEEIS